MSSYSSSNYSSDDDDRIESYPVQEKQPEPTIQSNDVTSSAPRQKRRDDFELGKLLGQGAFGQVLQVTDKETNKEYAMKVLSKTHIIKENKMRYVKVERDVMTKLNHPNVTRLLLTFQDPGNLYYVIEYAPNGDLQKKLNEKYAIDVPATTFLCSQLLLGIAHIHKHRILHRDLKPENILLDAENRVKITDFGTAKIFDDDAQFSYDRGSFVGSADYVSPEILSESPVGPSSDLWSYGCILYTLLVGEPPFHTESNYATFQKIQECKYEIPSFVPPDAKDLITKLLTLKPEERIGHEEYDSDYKSIRQHSFFNGINWNTVATMPIDNLDSFAPAVAVHQASLIPKIQSKVPELLNLDEKVLFEGMITKKRKLSSKKRLLVLTDKPRLFYVDMSSRKEMGSIELNRDTRVNVLKGMKWEVTIPGRVYDLVSDDKPPAEWKQAIDDVLQKLI